ncbi:DUF3617 family protein [Comamonas sp. lk]|uniref:DUF3617 domain-containing protein n=1 Tax=Comamonas sp. lk TaxID=2201272 RepID=UPI0013CF1621|nr:DUF3617 family protein [Comamonas sp. lk]
MKQSMQTGKTLLAITLCAAAAAAYAQTAEETQAGASALPFGELKVLQSIEPGLWQLKTRFEPVRKPPAPESGCITPQGIAEDLQSFLSQGDDGMSCTGRVQVNTEELAQLQVSCPMPPPQQRKAGKSEAKQAEMFKALPSLIEVRRWSPTHFTVLTKARALKSQPAFTLIQDYERQEDCPL